MNWYTIHNKANAAAPEIDIYGPIGDGWFDESVSARAFRDDLKAVKAKHLIININSPGGSVFDGLAIYNSLLRWKEDNGAAITVNIDGLAASIASVIAMAGDSIRIPRNGMMMIHNASGFAMGDYRVMQKTAAILESANSAIASVYEVTTGLIPGVIKAQMDAETWFIGVEAVENGYATEVVGAVELQACFGEECKQRWRNAPPELLNLQPASPPTSSGNAITLSNHKERDDMDETQVRALVQDALKEHLAELTDLKHVAAKLGEQLDKSTAALADMHARYENLVAETAAKDTAEANRIAAINGLFAMFDTAADRPYRESYLGLKAECLGDKAIDEAAARSKLLAMRQNISAGHAQAPVAGETDMVPPKEADFMAQAQALANQKGISVGQAVKTLATQHPELHAMWLREIAGA